MTGQALLIRVVFVRLGQSHYFLFARLSQLQPVLAVIISEHCPSLYCSFLCS